MNAVRTLFLCSLLCSCTRIQIGDGADMSIETAPNGRPAAKDMAPPQTPLVCIRCDAVINPCPRLGLVCQPSSGLCVGDRQ